MKIILKNLGPIPQLQQIDDETMRHENIARINLKLYTYEN